MTTAALLRLASSVTTALSTLRAQLETPALPHPSSHGEAPARAADPEAAQRAMVDDARRSASVISDPRLLEGYLYWRGKAGDRHMPRRADIDPIEIPRLLPHVRLIDVVGPGRYRYRLVGTEIQTFHGTNPTGRFVHELLAGPIGARIIAVYDECVRDRRAIYFENDVVAPDGSGLHRRSKVLFAPLSEDDQIVTQVLVFQIVLAANQFVRDTTDLYTGPYTEIIHAPL